jgi:hypothetical protein
MEPPIALEQPNVPDELLGKELALYYADPLGFVMAAYPWKQAGTELGHEEGPDKNQKQLLIDLGKEVAVRAFNGTDPVMPILMTGDLGPRYRGRAMGAWIADWTRQSRRRRRRPGAYRVAVGANRIRTSFAQ